MSRFLPDPIIRIVVCGNADRGDDGVALAAIATLLPTLPHSLLSKVEIRRCLELRVEDLVELALLLVLHLILEQMVFLRYFQQ